MTITDLRQLTNEQLAALAAEKVMGWRVRRETFQEDQDMHFGTGHETTFTDWVDSTGTFQMSVTDYMPCTDRNQSGRLLAKMVERGVSFLITRCVEGDPLGEDIEVSIPNHHGYCVTKSDARAETIASLLAWFAMEKQ